MGSVSGETDEGVESRRLVARLPRLPDEEIARRFREQGKEFRLSKATINVLYNICFVSSLPPTRNCKKIIDHHRTKILWLLDRKTPLKDKTTWFLAHKDLLRELGKSCRGG